MARILGIPVSLIFVFGNQNCMTENLARSGSCRNMEMIFEMQKNHRLLKRAKEGMSLEPA
jgi:hypothetical protein